MLVANVGILQGRQIATLPQHLAKMHVSRHYKSKAALSRNRSRAYGGTDRFWVSEKSATTRQFDNPPIEKRKAKIATEVDVKSIGDYGKRGTGGVRVGNWRVVLAGILVD